MRFPFACTLIVASACVAVLPTAAETVRFRATGVINGFEYNPGAAAAIFAEAPLGTGYTLDFAYDASAASLFGSASYAAYGPVVDAAFTLGSYDASLPSLNVTVGDIGMGSGDQFQLFGNAAFSPTERLAGYQLVDISFRLTDPTSSAFASPALPTAFDLAAFASRSLSARFAFGSAGETRLTLSVSAIEPLVAAVPEPGSWAMMIVGFGLIGAVTRRQAGVRPVGGSGSGRRA